MIVRKGPGAWATVHCHGAKKGKTIATFRTRGAAVRQHRAMMATRKKAKK